MGCVFKFSSEVSFSIGINVKTMIVTYFLDLMQFPWLAPLKTGQNWQKWENSDCFYIFGDFFVLFLRDIQNVGTKIFRKANSFQKKYQKFFENVLRSPKLTKNQNFWYFFIKKLSFRWYIDYIALHKFFHINFF